MSINPLTRADQGIGSALHSVSDTVLRPLWDITDGMISSLGNLETRPKKPLHNDIPTILQMAHRVYHSLLTYHKQIFSNSSQWAERVARGTQQITATVLYPLSFFHTGKAIQTILSEKVLGKIALTVSFCAFQIFQALPYLIVLAVAGGINLLYHTTPVGLITCLAGTMLMLQVYFIFRLVREVEITNEILQKQGEEFNQKIASMPSDITSRINGWFRSWLPSSLNFTKTTESCAQGLTPSNGCE